MLVPDIAPQAIGTSARFLFAAWLGTSAVLKLLDPVETADITAEYSIVPDSLEHAAVLATYPMIAIELVIPLLMLVGPYTKAALIPGISLISLYTLVLTYEIHKNNQMDNCGSYGTIFPQAVNWWRIFENKILILIGLTGLILV